MEMVYHIYSLFVGGWCWQQQKHSIEINFWKVCCIIPYECEQCIVEIVENKKEEYIFQNNNIGFRHLGFMYVFLDNSHNDPYGIYGLWQTK